MGRGGTKVYANSSGHITKIAVTTYMIRTGSLVILKLGMVHEERKVYNVYMDYDPGLTLA